MFIFTLRIYKFFADLRNVRRFVAIQIVIHYYMAPAVGHCAITWLLPAVGARSLRCFAIRSLGIRRRPATKRDALLAVDIVNVSVSAVTY